MACLSLEGRVSTYIYMLITVITVNLQFGVSHRHFQVLEGMIGLQSDVKYQLTHRWGVLCFVDRNV
jgi:hypothetical protein